MAQPRRTSNRTRRGSGIYSNNRMNESSDDDTSDDETTVGDDDNASSDKLASRMLRDHWKYNLNDKLDNQCFVHPEYVREMVAADFTLDFVKRYGLQTTLLFKSHPIELGMKMPSSKSFTVHQVKKLVGSKRRVEVIEVKSQKGRHMLLEDFVKYYKTPIHKRKELLNLLSLEFSLTELEDKVRGPKLIKQIDWVELFWPSELRERQKFVDPTIAEASTYPKVQNYCLMSVQGCYTDFHIDFGGTSVWYHVLKGEKVFWIIEPSEQNLVMYENWTLLGSNQNQTFFGDVVEKCARVRLHEGQTFVIPSGWIHAVYTPTDSLVFGGNFLHSYAIPMQLRIFKSEDKIRVSKKYRYPFYTHMLWYAAERIVRQALNRRYLNELKPYFATVATKEATVSLPNSSTIDDQKSITIADNESVDAISSVIGVGDECIAAKSEIDCDTVDDYSEQTSSVPQQTAITTPLKFDDEYLRLLSRLELDGFYALMNYLMRLEGKKREVAEGITQPDELLHDLQTTNDPPTTSMQSTVTVSSTPMSSSSAVNRSTKTPIKIEKRKRSAVDTNNLSKSSQKKKAEVDFVSTSESTTLPPPPPPNPYGFDPMAQLVALGHRPLQTAFRKTANMATVPQSHQAFRIPGVHSKPMQNEEMVSVASLPVTTTVILPSATGSGGPTVNVESQSQFAPTAEVRPFTAIRPPNILKHSTPISRQHHQIQQPLPLTHRPHYPELEHRSPLMQSHQLLPASSLSSIDEHQKQKRDYHDRKHRDDSHRHHHHHHHLSDRGHRNRRDEEMPYRSKPAHTHRRDSVPSSASSRRDVVNRRQSHPAADHSPVSSTSSTTAFVNSLPSSTMSQSAPKFSTASTVNSMFSESQSNYAEKSDGYEMLAAHAAIYAATAHPPILQQSALASVGYIPTPINRPSSVGSTAIAPSPVSQLHRPTDANQAKPRKSSNGSSTKRLSAFGAKLAIPPPQLVIPQLSVDKQPAPIDDNTETSVEETNDVEPMDGLSAINALVLLTQQMNNEETMVAGATVVESAPIIDTAVVVSSADSLRSLAEELSLLTQELNGIDD